MPKRRGPEASESGKLSKDGGHESPRVFRRLGCLSQAAMAPSSLSPGAGVVQLWRRHIADRLQQPAVVKPVDPFQRRILQRLPGSFSSVNGKFLTEVKGMDSSQPNKTLVHNGW